MEIMKNHWIVTGVGFALAIALAFSLSERANAPIAGDSPEVFSASSTETESATSTVAVIKPFPINAADTLMSWDFKGAYTGNTTLIAQANADITHLTGLVGGGKYDDYDLYNGIANDYGLLGEGKLAYQYYNRSIQVHPSKGLAYVNLAHLMSQLGALHTAADAYARAVAVEPGMLEYHVGRITFLTQKFPSNTLLITRAFTDAYTQFGDTPATLQVKAQWLTEQKQYVEAIKVWETVRMLSSESRQAAIDTEIARLKAKQ